VPSKYCPLAATHTSVSINMVAWSIYICYIVEL